VRIMQDYLGHRIAAYRPLHPRVWAQVLGAPEISDVHLRSFESPPVLLSFALEKQRKFPPVRASQLDHRRLPALPPAMHDCLPMPSGKAQGMHRHTASRAHRGAPARVRASCRPDRCRRSGSGGVAWGVAFDKPAQPLTTDNTTFWPAGNRGSRTACRWSTGSVAERRDCGMRVQEPRRTIHPVVQG
jgi:hypothetical protein